MYTSALYLPKGMSFAATEPMSGKETELSCTADAIVVASAGVLGDTAVLGVAAVLDAPESVLDAITLADACAGVKSAVAEAATEP